MENNVKNEEILPDQIGRLVLSSRNLYKIMSNSKLVSARKCYILSENLDDMLIQTNREFKPKDNYVLIDPNKKIVKEFLGTVGDPEDDLNIYHHLFTLSWESNLKYNNLWKELNFNPDFDITDKIGITRIGYDKKVITIDPDGAIDLDDGFSFDEDEENYYLDIHIADPISYFDLENETMIKIFTEFINRINTCYIPDTKGSGFPIHLLPEFVVEHVSLLQTTDKIKYRRSMSFCFKINKKTSHVDFSVLNTKLSTVSNTTYDKFDSEINSQSKSELKNSLVNLTNKLVEIMGLRYQVVTNNQDISHQMIEVFMIWVNYYSGIYLKNNSDKMIVRVQDEKDLPEDWNMIPNYCLNFINNAANYQLVDTSNNYLHHSLNIINYCHVSSPMRRIVDMLNHLLIYKYKVDLIDNLVDIDQINLKIKKQKKISNAYDLVKYLKTSNKFKGCIMDLKNFEERTTASVVLYSEPDFKKMINVEIPKTVQGLTKYQEIECEVYYNSINFKNSKFPFSIKII